MKFSKYISQQILFSSADNGDGEIRTLDPLLARQVLSQLSYRTSFVIQFNLVCTDSASSFSLYFVKQTHLQYKWKPTFSVSLQKGGVPAAPSGTATLLRLSPNYQFYPRTLLAVTYFRYPRLSWLDGRCVQGPGTYSPRHG